MFVYTKLWTYKPEAGIFLFIIANKHGLPISFLAAVIKMSVCTLCRFKYVFKTGNFKGRCQKKSRTLGYDK